MGNLAHGGTWGPVITLALSLSGVGISLEVSEHREMIWFSL